MKKVAVIIVAFAFVGFLSSCNETKPKGAAESPDAGQPVAAVQQEQPKIEEAVGEMQQQVESEQEVVAKAEAVVSQVTPQTEGFKKFVVYNDKSSADNHFIPSGWMGDYSDLKFMADCTDNPHSGGFCIKIEYAPNVSNGARWAGIYWQYPQNNWGNIEQSYNLSGATKLTFWARGQNGGERIEEFKAGGISGEYPDSDSASIGPVVLNAQWQKYEIDLAGKNLSHIIGGFAWATNIDVNPNGAVFYLDDIQYE